MCTETAWHQGPSVARCGRIDRDEAAYATTYACAWVRERAIDANADADVFRPVAHVLKQALAYGKPDATVVPVARAVAIRLQDDCPLTSFFVDMGDAPSCPLLQVMLPFLSHPVTKSDAPQYGIMTVLTAASCVVGEIAREGLLLLLQLPHPELQTYIRTHSRFAEMLVL